MYLCLRDTVIINYNIFLVWVTYNQFFNIGAIEDDIISRRRRIGHLINYMVWLQLTALVCRAYYQFYRSGGINGDRSERSSYEFYLDWFLSKLA